MSYINNGGGGHNVPLNNKGIRKLTPKSLNLQVLN